MTAEKQWRGRIPIIVLSATDDGDGRSVFIEAGMNDHLVKPVAPAVLYTTIMTWLAAEGAAADR